MDMRTAASNLADHIALALDNGSNPDLAQAFQTAWDIHVSIVHPERPYVTPDVKLLVQTVDNLQEGERVKRGKYARPRFAFVSAEGEVYDLAGHVYRHTKGFIPDEMDTLDQVRAHSKALHASQAATQEGSK